MRRGLADVLPAMRLGIQPAHLRRFESDVAGLAAGPRETAIEPAERDHDAVRVVMGARLPAWLVAVFEHPDALVLEDDAVLVWIGLGRIGHRSSSQTLGLLVTARSVLCDSRPDR